MARGIRRQADCRGARAHAILRPEEAEQALGSMTALSEYQRLEAAGLWRASPDAQRTDVIVSLGDATLVITDMQDRPLAHWSIPAVERANPGRLPALYHPDGDPGETLELPETERDAIAAIERLRAAVRRRRPHPGRLRLVALLAMLAAVAVLSALWLPGALRAHAVTVVPEAKRAEIGQDLMRHIQRVTGPPCRDPGGAAALARLARRLPGQDGPGRLVVLRGGVQSTAHLPGGTILINRTLVEDHEDPEVLAGYLVAERLRAARRDPLGALLAQAGAAASLRLLTTGALSDATLRAYSEHLLTRSRGRPDTEALLAAFRKAGVRSTPYAYALDISGETTLGLIEADPFAGQVTEPVLSDADWLRLQGICET